MAMKIGSSGGSQSVSRADGQDNQRALTPLSPKGFDEKTNTLYEVKKGDSMSALWESGGKAVSWDEFLSRNSHISQAKGRDGGAKLIPGDTLVLPKSEAGWRAGGTKQPRAEVAAPVAEHTAPAATSEQKAERLSTGFHNALETLRGAAQHAATLPAQQRQEALTSLLSSATTMTNTLQSEARSQLGEVATEFLKPQPTLGDIRRQLTDVVMMKGDAAAQAPAPAATQETQSWAAKARASIDRIGKSISADGAERTEKIRDLQKSVHADAG